MIFVHIFLIYNVDGSVRVTLIQIRNNVWCFSHICIQWRMTLASVTSCEITKASTGITSAVSVLVSDNTALIIQNICPFRAFFFAYWNLTLVKQKFNKLRFDLVICHETFLVL